MLTVSSCFQDAPTACAARHSSHFSNLHCLPSSAAIPFVMPGTIGFVGFGNVNSTLAEFAVKAGYRVIVSNSRGPASLAGSVAKLGPLATAATVQDAVLRSDVVSVSIPFKNLEQLPAGPFNGKIVIDSMNYYPQRDGDIEDLDSRRYAKSELVQQHLEGSHVVKAFHSIDQFHLRIGPRPVNHPDRWALPIAGDDADAKAVVASFVGGWLRLRGLRVVGGELADPAKHTRVLRSIRRRTSSVCHAPRNVRVGEARPLSICQGGGRSRAGSQGDHDGHGRPVCLGLISAV
jgi:predicted dinucleotide-binding enzyme